MKRYPKRARPLWGVAKRRRAIRGHGLTGPTGVSITFGEGTVLVSGNTYTFPRGPGPRGVLTFTTDGTTPTIDPGTVLVLPTVEVRLP